MRVGPLGALVVLGTLALCLGSGEGAAQPLNRTIDLDPPGEREFIGDHAGLLSVEDFEFIRETCDALLTDRGMPIIVITVNSLADHGGANMRIETFATVMFNEWGIGYEELGGIPLNRGILLLVSVADRKARIELGADWAHDFDVVCTRIMDEHIIYEFKREAFSQGIQRGVVALDQMARGLSLPTRPRPWWHYGLVVGLIGLAIFTAASLIRRGSGGWAWVFWAAVFALLGVLLYQMLTQRSRGSGGGFGGGSFGGGSSGGGGASGSW